MKSTRHNLCARSAAAASLLVVALGGALAHAILVQPHNHMLDDSPLTSQHESSGSLSPFYNDQTGASEAAADRDIVSIIGDGLARLRFARMLEHTGQGGDEQHLSQEMAELIQDEQQREQAAGKQEAAGEQQASLSSSVASMLLGAAQAAAAQAQEERAERPAHETGMSSRGNIMELDTSGPQSAGSLPSKSDLNKQPSQWYNPKETIPVLKISSMATPSKYKKVYFRSEKKLVDGAFHSPASEHDESGKSKSLVKSSFNSAGVQRRSSRGSSASAPPSVLQDGVIDFLKKFRDVYVQTRPAGSPSTGANLASSVVSAAASSPFASFLAPSSGSGRPNLMGAISTATQMGAMLSQAASGSGGSGGAAASPSSGSSAVGSAAAAGTAAAAAGSGPSKSPLSAQSYVSFWSKTFPTWVRKMLKQMRRRSLYNSSKRQQQHHNHHHSAGVGQKIASGAVSSLTGESSSSSSSSSSNGGGSSS